MARDVVMHVAEPPPIPAFEGDYVPDATRAQRLRFRFSKKGDAVFVGHLDLMRVRSNIIRCTDAPRSPYVTMVVHSYVQICV